MYCKETYPTSLDNVMEKETMDGEERQVPTRVVMAMLWMSVVTDGGNGVVQQCVDNDESGQE